MSNLEVLVEVKKWDGESWQDECLGVDGDGVEQLDKLLTGDRGYSFGANDSNGRHVQISEPHPAIAPKHFELTPGNKAWKIRDNLHGLVVIRRDGAEGDLVYALVPGQQKIDGEQFDGYLGVFEYTGRETENGNSILKPKEMYFTKGDWSDGTGKVRWVKADDEGHLKLLWDYVQVEDGRAYKLGAAKVEGGAAEVDKGVKPSIALDAKGPGIPIKKGRTYQIYPCDELKVEEGCIVQARKEYDGDKEVCVQLTGQEARRAP